MTLRNIKLVALASLLPLGLYIALVHPCDSGGAMAGEYEACATVGIEWLMYDGHAHDGPRRSLCFGWVIKRSCHANRWSPAIPCP